MTLEERINSIDMPKIKDIPNVGLLPNGKADTVEEFFCDFVKQRLPNEDVIRKWHTLLKDYVSDLSKVSCCVRYGYQRGPKDGTKWGEVGDDALRRGWVTQNTTDEFEYFFTDNHFCTYTYKMALCGFVPELKELREFFVNHKFPYGFMYYLRIHPEVEGAVVKYGKNPGFSSNYKISHVFDAGASFKVNDRSCNDAELSPLYYPLGHRDDFLKNANRIRKMEITDEAKKVIVAKFLRLVHPFNYFLTPTTHPKVHKYDPVAAVSMNDIGEDSRLLHYMRNYLKGKYPDIYKEFLEMTLWPEDSDVVYRDTSGEYIGMVYGPCLKGKSTSGKDKAKTFESVVDFSKIDYTYLNDNFKVGMIARKVLGAILESGKLSKADVDAFKTAAGTQAAFGIDKPLLSPIMVRTSNVKRYYVKPFVLYGESLFLYSQWYDTNKETLIKWILDWISANGGKI